MLAIEVKKKENKEKKTCKEQGPGHISPKKQLIIIINKYNKIIILH